MEFDLFTFIAQVVNFLILVALLRIFLYKRVIQAMDDREAKIASRLQNAEEKQKEAEQKASTYEKRKSELERERDELLEQARQEAEQRREELIEQAHQEVDQRRQEWHEGLQQQQEQFLATLRRRAGEQAYQIARKALQDLAEQDLDERIGRVFLKRLRSLDEQQRGELRDKLSDSGSARLSSAFQLPAKLREELARELSEIADSEVDLAYESSPELIAGVELRIEDKKIGFSLDQYLDDLEERLNRILARETEQAHARQ
jgi:F-type H+-transporting ATPase subunit b